MSADRKAPPAPQLRAIREAWLGKAIERLEADPAVRAAGLVGSLGRGDADDWSDIDLLIVVPDGQVDRYADATRLPGSEQVIWSIDARHNAPRGRSPDAGRMVEFVGGPHAPQAPPGAQLAMLRQLLVQHHAEAPEEMLAANSRYLDLAEAVL